MSHRQRKNEALRDLTIYKLPRYAFTNKIKSPPTPTAAHVELEVVEPFFGQKSEERQPPPARHPRQYKMTYDGLTDLNLGLAAPLEE